MSVLYNISKLLSENNLTQKDLSDHLGISKNAMTDWKSGRIKSYTKYLPQIADYLGVSVDQLLNGSYTHKPCFKIPVLGKVQAGLPIEAVENIIDYEEISEEMAKKGEYFALQVRGDSMQPRMFEGDIVVVMKQSTISSGETAIIMVENELATCKVVKCHNGGITLMSHNKNYEPMYYSNEQIKSLPITILGKAVEIRGKL